MASKGATRKGVSKGTSKKQPARDRKVDWAGIERDYRAGVISVRSIGRKFGLTEKAVRKHAAKHGWSRDLSQQVKTGVREALVREEVRTVNAAKEQAIVADAVATSVEVVRQHRRDIAGLRQTAEMLLGDLQASMGARVGLEAAIAEETKDDKATARRAAMLRAVSLPGHAGILRDLSVVMKNLIPLERQAFNLDDDAPPPPPEDTRVGDEQIGRLRSRLLTLGAPRAPAGGD